MVQPEWSRPNTMPMLVPHQGKKCGKYCFFLCLAPQKTVGGEGPGRTTEQNSFTKNMICFFCGIYIHFTKKYFVNVKKYFFLYKIYIFIYTFYFYKNKKQKNCWSTNSRNISQNVSNSSLQNTRTSGLRPTKGPKQPKLARNGPKGRTLHLPHLSGNKCKTKHFRPPLATNF